MITNFTEKETRKTTFFSLVLMWAARKRKQKVPSCGFKCLSLLYNILLFSPLQHYSPISEEKQKNEEENNESFFPSLKYTSWETDWKIFLEKMD